MPIPEPKKDESQDDFMQRCMHEASKNPDRSNDQNVAICLQTWRDAKKEQKAKNMNQFKTLTEARGAYDELTAKLADYDQKTVRLAELESQLAEVNTFRAEAQTENDGFRTLIVQKDTEIAGLKAEQTGFLTEISGLKNELETSKKSQKSAKLHARELVAATGGAPIAVDAGEIAKMQAGDEKEYLATMAKTTDSAELNRLYREYNKLFRPNGKHKKS